MTQRTTTVPYIIIENGSEGQPLLFERAIRRGGEVKFKTDLQNASIDFGTSTPLEGSASFSVPPPGVTKTVRSDAALGSYPFEVKVAADLAANLNLEVGIPGVDESGIRVVSSSDVRLRLVGTQDAAGQVDVTFDNRTGLPVSLEAKIRARVSVVQSIAAGIQTKTFESTTAPGYFGTVLVLTSGPSGAGPSGQGPFQTGGTQQADIYIE